MIRYVRGDVTRPEGPDPLIIAHVCNDAGGFGKGVAGAIAAAYPDVRARYKAWFADPAAEVRPALGNIQPVRVGAARWVVNMIAQHGYRDPERSPGAPAPIRYVALRTALGKLGEFARRKKASVHIPKIGTGYAGGSWDAVEPLVVEFLADAGVSVTVYEWGQ